MKWHQVSRAVLFVTLVSLAGQAGPAKTQAQPFASSLSQSVQVPVAAQRAIAFSLDHFTVDARFTPAELPVPGFGRRMPTHHLVPEAVFQRIKAAALHNPYAPFDPFARSFFDRLRPLTPAPLVKFAGLAENGGVEPPDMALAVSPNWVAQGVNLQFAVFNRAGTLQSGWPKDIGAFFHVPSPGSCDPTPFMSDPRAFYLISDQRFVLAALQVDGAIIGTTCAPLSKYWIAVSKTNNPNGAWNIYSFDMRAGTQNVADFTQIGYDANGIYFSGNMFDSSSGTYQYAEIFGAPKAKMEAGTAVTAHGFSKLKAGGLLVDTVQPVDSLTQPPLITTQPVEYFINSKNILNCSGVCNGVTVWAFANVLTTPTLTAANIATTNYSVPPNAPQPAGGSINTDDQRISGTPVYQGGLISFGLTTAVTNVDSMVVAGLFWGQVKPTLSGTTITGGSVFQSGYLSFRGNRGAYYPALVPDSRGNLYIGFGSSSSTSSASAYYAARKVTDVHGALETTVPLFLGSGAYLGGRWGDYSAAAIDGNLTTSDAWVYLEYGTSAGLWATEIGATRF